MQKTKPKRVSDTQTKSQILDWLKKESKVWKQSLKTYDEVGGYFLRDTESAIEFEKQMAKLAGVEFMRRMNFMVRVSDLDIDGVEWVLEEVANIEKPRMPWNKKITEAEVEGGFTKHDRISAADWQCCVFVEKLKLDSFAIYEGYENKLTKKAYDKGCAFSSLVRDDETVLARECYHEIREMQNIWA